MVMPLWDDSPLRGRGPGYSRYCATASCGCSNAPGRPRHRRARSA